MQSLQRLQQYLLATDPVFSSDMAITRRAQRLRTAFRRSLAVGLTATTALAGAVGYLKVGPGTYDPNRLYIGSPTDSRVMASIFDSHRHLIAAHDRVEEIKSAMINGESVDGIPISLEKQAVLLREAQKEELRLQRAFALQTRNLSTAQVQHIVGDAADNPQPSVDSNDRIEIADDSALPQRSRFKP